MAKLDFDDEMGRIQRALAQCHDMIARQSMVLQALNLRTGARVLELGCGGGFYAREAGQFVGATGYVSAIDISADQIAVARERCAELPWVECRVADIMQLPHASAEFDVVYGVQVLEYMPDVGKALQEIRRVLRPGGRLINLATNWSSAVWHSRNPARMNRVLAEWAAHAPYLDLPAILAAELRKAGVQPLRQRPAPILNMSYNENSFSYWVARMIARFVAGRGAVTREDADAWLAEFTLLETDAEYFFSSTPVLTEAIKAA
jgi:arsenite methyltransferase